MKTVAKKDVDKILSGWAEKYEVFAPIRTETGEFLLGCFTPQAFTLDYKKLPLSPKGLFLPPTEVIFQFEKGEYRDVLSPKDRIIFGLRPCDMMGILQTSSFMTRDHQDIYYRTRLNTALTIVVACPQAQNETCFCTTTLSGPVARKGFDLQFYDLGETFLVEEGSSRGRDLLSGFSLADMDDASARKRIGEFERHAVKSIPEAESVVQAMHKIRERNDFPGVWEDLGARCIACGGCSFVCPTCTCFNVYDQAFSPEKGVRVRAWDACLYGGFTREASGHNPRQTQARRLQRRHEHKLRDYSKVDIQDGLCGCVGCGRCSDFCPVHIGTLEVARAIAGTG